MLHYRSDIIILAIPAQPVRMNMDATHQGINCIVARKNDPTIPTKDANPNALVVPNFCVAINKTIENEINNPVINKPPVTV